MRSRGVEVFLAEELLTEVLDSPEARGFVLAHILNERDETTLRRRGRPDSRRLQGIEVFRRAACRKQPTSAPRGLSAYLAWWCGCHDPAC
jgi:hypothetical protein